MNIEDHKSITTETLVQMSLIPLIEEVKRRVFTPEYQDKVTTEEVLGIIISKYSEWDGQKIFDIMQNAFEDSNFHSFNAKMSEEWNKENK